MAAVSAQSCGKLIVRNLPKVWGQEDLKDCLAVHSGGLIVAEGVQMFPRVYHTALLSLKHPLTDLDVDRELQCKLLGDTCVLQLELIRDFTCSVLVHASDPSLRTDLLRSYFDQFLQFCGYEGEGVVACDSFLDNLGFAVIYFSSPEAAELVMSQDTHPVQEGSDVAVEHWYHSFHGQLMEELSFSQIPSRTLSLSDLRDPADIIYDQTGSEGNGGHKHPEQNRTVIPQAMKSLNKHSTEGATQGTKLAEIRVDIASHGWQLVRDAVSQSAACLVRYEERDELVVFSGTQAECEDGKLLLLKLKQNLNEDSVPVSEAMVKYLATDQGLCWFDEMVRKHPDCSVKIDHLTILCAALSQRHLDLLMQDLQTALSSKRIQGLKKSVDVPPDEADKTATDSQTCTERFAIAGQVEGEACRKWFSPQLDQTKAEIYKNGGQVIEESKENAYHLTYQCPADVLPKVKRTLDGIKSGIFSTKINMAQEFQDHSEQALVINGLHDMGERTFCFQVEQRLSQEHLRVMFAVTLPAKCSLSLFGVHGYKKERDGKAARGPPTRPHPPSSLTAHRAVSRSEPDLRQPSANLLSTVTVGKIQITVKTGDIAVERADAAVSAVGMDMNLEKTAVGSAFLRKCPALNEVLIREGIFLEITLGEECQLVRTCVPEGSNLPMSTIFHAALTKLSTPQAVTQEVDLLVFRSLVESEKKKLASVAFPALGVCRRFGFDADTTASAMMTAIRRFLQSKKPKHLRTISIVVYKNATVAKKFVDAMTRTFQHGGSSRQTGRQIMKTLALVGRTLSRGVSALAHKIQSSRRGTMSRCDPTSEGPQDGDKAEAGFEATVCVTRQQDLKKAKDVLLEEARERFLWLEVLKEHKADDFRTLPKQVLQDIAQTAVRNNVLLSASTSAVNLTGQKTQVQELLLLINENLQDPQLTRAPPGHSRRQELGLPVDTDQLPTYWRVCAENPRITYSEAKHSWRARGTRLNPVPAETRAAVERLVTSTWDTSKVGKGKDALNLAHTDIQVTGVERLENPELWQMYSQKRERLLDALAHHHKGSYAVTCRPVESFQASRGPVQTALDPGSALDLEMHHQVNEHYLFHGTKPEALRRIYSEGLDDRLCQNAMLGHCLYTSESSTKADQYADDKQHRTTLGTPLKMLLLRVLLGEPFLYTDDNPHGFKRPPCFKCIRPFPDCSCHESRLFDSVVYDSTKLFREFAVYDRHVVYPEYIITYIRK